MQNLLSDEQLWHNITNDSHDDFNELYNRYWEVLYTNAFYKLKDADSAANVVQDVFVTIWRRRKFINIVCIKTYLGCAVKYSVMKELKNARKFKTAMLDEIPVSASSTVQDAGFSTIYTSLELAIDKELNKLPLRCKEIFLLSRRNELSAAEIAAYFNISRRTVDNQITLALRHLRGSLKNIIGSIITIIALLFY